MSEVINISRIEFDDGSFLTFEQAAKRVIKENKLTKGYWIKNGLRPVTGVLEEWTRCGNANCIEPYLCYTPVKKRRLSSSWFAVSISANNDRGIEETDEEHCIRMVKWLRELKRG